MWVSYFNCRAHNVNHICLYVHYQPSIYHDHHNYFFLRRKTGTVTRQWCQWSMAAANVSVPMTPRTNAKEKAQISSAQRNSLDKYEILLSGFTSPFTHVLHTLYTRFTHVQHTIYTRFTHFSCMLYTCFMHALHIFHACLRVPPGVKDHLASWKKSPVKIRLVSFFFLYGSDTSCLGR